MKMMVLNGITVVILLTIVVDIQCNTLNRNNGKYFSALLTICKYTYDHSILTEQESMHILF